MKKAIIIPVYLRLERPEDLSVSEGMVLTRRAVQSLRVLTDPDFDLILPVFFSFPEMSQDFLIKAEKAFRDEMKLCRPKGTIVFSPSQLEAFRKWAERIDPPGSSLEIDDPPLPGSCRLFCKGTSGELGGGG